MPSFRKASAKTPADGRKSGSSYQKKWTVSSGKTRRYANSRYNGNKSCKRKTNELGDSDKFEQQDHEHTFVEDGSSDRWSRYMSKMRLICLCLAPRELTMVEPTSSMANAAQLYFKVIAKQEAAFQ
mgnify:CR=1